MTYNKKRGDKVLFDPPEADYAWWVVINQIRNIDQKFHVAYRLNNTKTLYDYCNGFFSRLVFVQNPDCYIKCRLGELYQKVKKDLVNIKFIEALWKFNLIENLYQNSKCLN